MINWCLLSSDNEYEYEIEAPEVWYYDPVVVRVVTQL